MSELNFDGAHFQRSILSERVLRFKNNLACYRRSVSGEQRKMLLRDERRAEKWRGDSGTRGDSVNDPH